MVKLLTCNTRFWCLIFIVEVAGFLFCPISCHRCPLPSFSREMFQHWRRTRVTKNYIYFYRQARSFWSIWCDARRKRDCNAKCDTLPCPPILPLGGFYVSRMSRKGLIRSPFRRATDTVLVETRLNCQRSLIALTLRLSAPFCCATLYLPSRTVKIGF